MRNDPSLNAIVRRWPAWLRPASRAMIAEGLHDARRADADRARSASSASPARRSAIVALWDTERVELRRGERRQLRPVRHRHSGRRRPAVAGDFGRPSIDREDLPRGEYYALMLFALAGMMLMATATDLLVIFLALEVLSIAVYVLTGIRRDSPASHRSGVQVFPARRVLERVLPLRHRVHVRRHRQHPPRSDRQP